MGDAEMACPTPMESLGRSGGTSCWQWTRCIREPRRTRGGDGPLRTARAVGMALGDLGRHWVAVKAELGSLLRSSPLRSALQSARGRARPSLELSLSLPFSVTPTCAGSWRSAVPCAEGRTPRGCRPGPPSRGPLIS